MGLGYSVDKDRLTKSDIKLFWEKVDKQDNCWVWTANRDDSGYGLKRSTGYQRYLKAHRISYALEYGYVPGDKIVCHHCDNPPCVNPNHLFLGTHSDNIQDAIRKGRLNDRRGENNSKDILTKEQVKEIVRRIKNKETVSEIAEDYPVTKSAIVDIKRGKNWSHITGIEEAIGRKPTKLSNEEVKEICERYITRDEDITQPELAKEYNISITHVRRILHGDRRKKVDRPTKDNFSYKGNKLTDEDIKEIAHRYIIKEEEITQNELAKEYGVTRKYINEVLCGKERKDVKRPIVDENYNASANKLSKQDVKDICYRYIESNEEIYQYELGEEYNVNQSYISALLSGKKREDVERPTL